MEERFIILEIVIYPLNMERGLAQDPKYMPA